MATPVVKRIKNDNLTREFQVLLTIIYSMEVTRTILHRLGTGLPTRGKGVASMPLVAPGTSIVTPERVWLGGVV